MVSCIVDILKAKLWRFQIPYFSLMSCFSLVLADNLVGFKLQTLTLGHNLV